MTAVWKSPRPAQRRTRPTEPNESAPSFPQRDNDNFQVFAIDLATKGLNNRPQRFVRVGGEHDTQSERVRGYASDHRVILTSSVVTTRAVNAATP